MGRASSFGGSPAGALPPSLLVCSNAIELVDVRTWLTLAALHPFALTSFRRYFDDCGGMSAIEERPLIYASNASMTFTPEDVPVYNSIASYDTLRKTLEDKLREYNESNAVMELVLFQQAMEHITRIARIIDLPRGNAMLVGVGGSGKQSLARLASYICGYEVYQISVSSTYGINDFKENLLGLYRKAGMKGTPITFLMTDNQIVKEGFLVYINDLLSTGYIADLFTPEDKEAFCNAVRNEVKASGQIDTVENCWDFFIDKVGAVGCKRVPHACGRLTAAGVWHMPVGVSGPLRR